MIDFIGAKRGYSQLIHCCELCGHLYSCSFGWQNNYPTCNPPHLCIKCEAKKIKKSLK